MGIDYDGKLLVGGHFEDVSEIVEKTIEACTDEYGMCESEALEELGLDYASPYYDCPLEECWVGFEFPDTPFTEGWYKAFEEAAKKWKELTGVDAKLMGVQNIW